MTFEPGCRNSWHIHHKGDQILLAAGGRGWYQTRANPPGNSAPEAGWTFPEVKLWHGAAADSWVSHLAVAIPPEGGSNQWLEPVSGEEYGKL